MARMKPDQTTVTSAAVTKSITLPTELWAEIIDCQHAERLISQAETIRRVVTEGIAVLKKKRRERNERV